MGQWQEVQGEGLRCPVSRRTKKVFIMKWTVSGNRRQGFFWTIGTRQRFSIEVQDTHCSWPRVRDAPLKRHPLEIWTLPMSEWPIKDRQDVSHVVHTHCRTLKHRAGGKHTHTRAIKRNNNNVRRCCQKTTIPTISLIILASPMNSSHIVRERTPCLLIRAFPLIHRERDEETNE